MSAIRLTRALAFAALAACSQQQQEKDGPARPAPQAAAAASEPPDVEAPREINPRLLRRFRPLDPLPEETAATRAQADLGRLLFFEPRISKSGRIACSTCHDLKAYGVDARPTSAGHHGKLGTRNAPTVYNAAGAFAQFWDGRAATLEEQAKLPIVNPVEMAMTDPSAVVAALKAIPGYADAFAHAFPGERDPIHYDNAARALGAFERRLVTPSRWDAFLRGDANALTPAEKDGLRTFLNVGCMVCHTGTYVGGSMFERAGAVEPWPNQKDQGRAEVTKSPADAMMFKVPSLRNVEKTAPYFHDGSVDTLDDAVRMMGRHQLGLDLSPGEVASIVAWLKTLTGELPTAYIDPPEIPK